MNECSFANTEDLSFKAYYVIIQSGLLKISLICFYCIGPNFPKWRANALSRHQMVNIGPDLIVIGGHSERLKGGYSNDLFKLSCSNNVCDWEILSQKMHIPRYWFVAISVPDDFITCTNCKSGPTGLPNCKNI